MSVMFQQKINQFAFKLQNAIGKQACNNNNIVYKLRAYLLTKLMNIKYMNLHFSGSD